MIRRSVVSLKTESIEPGERTKSYMARHIVQEAGNACGWGGGLLHAQRVHTMAFESNRVVLPSFA